MGCRSRRTALGIAMEAVPIPVHATFEATRPCVKKESKREMDN